MRTVVLLLMVALLPLRLWAADGMAVRMAEAQVVAAAATASSTAGHSAAGHAMPADCPMLTTAEPASSDHEGGTSTAQCTACHLCAAAIAEPVFQLGHAPAPAGPPQARPARYADADLAVDLRPPIS